MHCIFEIMRILWFAFLFLLLASSCSTDLNITTDWKEIPIVYGLLDAAEDTQYVRITKAYLDPQRSALELARVTDSLYFKDGLQVQLLRLSDNQLFPMQWVDAALLGKPRDPGLFAEAPNFMFIHTQPLQKGGRYRLVIDQPASNQRYSAESPVLGDLRITAPAPGLPIAMQATRVDVAFRTVESAKVYEPLIRLHYVEWNILENPTRFDTTFIDFKAGTIVTTTTRGDITERFSLDGREWYNFLGQNLSKDPALRRRLVLPSPISIGFNLAGEDLYDFIRITNAQSGISQLQALPVFTNIENGLGVFSARTRFIQDGYSLTPQAVDSLRCGRFTLDLNFENGNICR